MLVLLAITMPGAIVAYVLFLRPELAAMPRFKEFYARSDGFWAKVWALCGKSVAMAFAYFIQGLSWCLQWIDPIASFFGDPELRTQITDGLGANPKLLGYALMFISAATIAAKVHSLATKGDE